MNQNHQVHTVEIFTYRFEGEHCVERAVYFVDLQKHAPHGTLTVRVKERTINSRFLLYIDPEMVCRLMAGLDDFVMRQIFVPGSTPGATLAIDMGNGMKYTISESAGHYLKIIKSELRVGVERCAGCIRVPAGRYRLLRNGLEGAYRAWQEEIRQTQP